MRKIRTYLDGAKIPYKIFESHYGWGKELTHIEIGGKEYSVSRDAHYQRPSYKWVTQGYYVDGKWRRNQDEVINYLKKIVAGEV